MACAMFELSTMSVDSNIDLPALSRFVLDFEHILGQIFDPQNSNNVLELKINGISEKYAAKQQEILLN